MGDRQVRVIPWGDIANPDASRQWGLMVGDAYVCRDKEVLLFKNKEDAEQRRQALEEKLKAPTND